MQDVEREEVVVVIDRAIDDLLRDAGIDKPPVDAIGLARSHLGMEVCVDNGQPQRGRAQRSAGARQIYLRPEPTVERHQWTVAHEIGEHFKASLLARLGIEAQQTSPFAGETLANLFAYHLLVPACWLTTDAPSCAYDLLHLKALYATASHEVIAWRMLDLPQPCIITVLDNNRIHRRRSNAWVVRKKLAAAEEKCQQCVHAHGRPHLVREEGWTVQGWPIHRTEWKREILRSVIEAD
ncbi:MAG TPA: ImmA/IrrE family metallo-endopeptidase [Gemmataceae bacterium]|jgi:hypothetical protein|nr:ImmA/IrrE family metallo-endopeptidase [Gemmataceae bacterium]